MVAIVGAPGACHMTGESGVRYFNRFCRQDEIDGYA